MYDTKGPFSAHPQGRNEINWSHTCHCAAELKVVCGAWQIRRGTSTGAWRWVQCLLDQVLGLGWPLPSLPSSFKWREI